MAAHRLTGKLVENVFWSAPRYHKDSIVPGVTDVSNLRPKVKGGRTREVRASVPVVQSVIQVLDPLTSRSTTSEVSTVLTSNRSNVPSNRSDVASKHVSLRDLCVEDKKRVATLIKELAKLGEEKENAEKNLEEERKHYEEQILKLVEQQEQILKEREEVETKLLEYEEYILKLQQQSQVQQANSHGGYRSGDQGHPVRSPALLSEKPEVKNINTSLKEEESCFGDCSTQVLPSRSWTESFHNRPFTARIDREIDQQNEILAASFLSSPQANTDLKKNNFPQNNYLVDEFRSSSPKQADNSEELKGQSSHSYLAISEQQQYGNTELLTLEKKNLIHRLIESQTKLKPMAEEGVNLNRGDKHLKKSRHRQPPNFGPLHPPVMSSTQKSSEIGEEVESIFTIEPVHPDRKLGPALEYMDENSNNNCDDKAHNPDNQEIKFNSKAGKNPEEKAMKDAEIERLQQAGIDQEFLRKYKKMSAFERKQELLRQRAMLLEEQNRLRVLLAEQEAHLKKEVDKAGLGSEQYIIKKTKSITTRATAQEMKSADTRERNMTVNNLVSSHSESPIHNSQTGNKDLNDNISSSEVHLEKCVQDGKDGDQCTLYPDWPTKGVARKLDYSQSDSASTQSSQDLRSPRLVSKEVMTSPKLSLISRLHDDKSTSISYRHLPRVISTNPLGSRENLKEDIRSNSLSPKNMEKTLSLLEIISTLSDTKVPRKMSHERDSKSSPGNVRIASDSSHFTKASEFSQGDVIKNDSDPNLSLFVLNKNFIDLKDWENVSTKWEGEQNLKEAILTGHHKAQLLDQRGVQSSFPKPSSPGSNDILDEDEELFDILDAIHSLEHRDSTKSQGLDELEESQILEEVFFI